MINIHQSYNKLQRHLDKQAVGFPATKSGAEIKILQHIFSPAEAELATCLTYQPEPIEIIFQRAKHLVESPATKEDLYNIIMAHKKGRLGKLKITGKLITDAVRTKQTHLLK